MSDEPGAMSDVELQALAALVSAYTIETLAANEFRRHQGLAPAYEGIAGPKEMQKLEEELKRRGVL